MADRVVLGLSGGAGSAWAAKRLLQEGWDVRAVYLQYDEGVDRLPLARQAAAVLDIPLTVVDVTYLMETLVRGHFYAGFRQGRPALPCDRCMALVRFPALLREADRLGAEKIATGHNVVLRGGRLYRPAHSGDQSMRLWRLTPDGIDRCLFPCGTQVSVRAMRDELHGMIQELTPPSEGVCFGAGKMINDDLHEHDAVVPEGPLVLDDPEIGGSMGTHRAAVYFAGQRKIMFTEAGVYVRSVDPLTNTVHLIQREPRYRAARLGFMNLVEPQYGQWPSFRCHVLVWEERKPRPATVYPAERYVVFDRETSLGPFRFFGDLIPGRPLVFYAADGALIGGGVIDSTEPKNW